MHTREVFYYIPMAKIDKITYDVREALNAYSDDVEISDEYIIYLYGIKRAKYLRQQLNNANRTIDLSIQQKFCIGLEEVSINECGLDYECGNILKSVVQLPKFLDLHTKPAIVSIKPTNILSIPFHNISIERARFVDGAAFPNSLYSFLYTDNYLYVYSKDDSYKLLECVTITGVFDDPIELNSYSNCCNCEEVTPCFDPSTTEYPLQSHFIDLIRKEIVQELVGKLQIPEDKANNSDSQ